MKYGNRRTVVDGVSFDSAAEARRYVELKLLERAGQITDLELQPKFNLTVNGIHICNYSADFRYVEGGTTTIEDCKGYRTREYLMKKRLMLAVHNITIKET